MNDTSCDKFCKCDQCIIDRFKRNPILRKKMNPSKSSTPAPPKYIRASKINNKN